MAGDRSLIDHDVLPGRGEQTSVGAGSLFDVDDPFADGDDERERDDTTASGAPDPFLLDPFAAPRTPLDPFTEEFELDDLDPEAGDRSRDRAEELLAEDLLADTAARLHAPPTGTPGANPETAAQQRQRDFDMRSWLSRVKRALRLGGAGPQVSGPRAIVLNASISGEPAHSYASNNISTTKYNIATFLPKFLFEQFSKYANLFFLCTALIQQVPHVSPTNRYTTVGTLLVVLIVSGVKELVEDSKRYSSDKVLNSADILILDPRREQFYRRRWVDVKVGDIVKVTNEQPMPADLVLLASSEPEGLCYIETSNLDGETNLKIKQSLPETAHLLTPTHLSELRGRIDSEQPNSSLYRYEGTLDLGDAGKLPLAADQMLLRGTSLRNTAWVYGVVVFTGHETKLMRNATATPIKRTAVEHMINLQIVFLFCILIAMSILSSLGNVIKQNQWRRSMWYLGLQKTSSTSTFFLDLLTYWILFSNLVPISLFVTVEIIKFYQGYLISSDLEMYYPDRDVPAVCRTSSLVEELGQIQYIFSDKTGTLTRNIMEFKACSVGGQMYAADVPEEKRQKGRHRTFDDLVKELGNGSKQGAALTAFFSLLATCHTVIPEAVDGRIKYQASSPDEGALVEGAAALGFKFTARRPRSVTVVVNGVELEYELLNLCEFNSTRKRMSTIFRCPDGRIRLFCKGADTTIVKRLNRESSKLIPSLFADLEEFASEGLRTLCVAAREVTESEYHGWAERYAAAATAMENRSEKLDAVAEEIEVNLTLLGATAIEDKLQDGVPETIHTLQDAGLKIWVLTGDRQETAISVGLSAKLLSEDMNLLLVNELDEYAVSANIERKLATIKSGAAHAADYESLALVIDGNSLTHALQPGLDVRFLELAVMCKAVICCRVSPLQKAMVVRLAKRHLKALLLAIGDGANDVSMIQAAHVGVGISGMEGQQAARSADVAIGQFRFLRRLLLVHGAWSYNRLSHAILYSFYKNIALYLTQFVYVFFNGFSGQSIYESWTVTFYNVICTVLPPFAMGIFDQFVSARLLLRYPQLYKLGQNGAFFNTRVFWEWIVNGIYHSVIIFFVGAATYGAGNVLPNGRIANHWTWGTATFFGCVLTVLGKAALVTTMWNRWTLIAIPGSFLIWLVFFPIYSTAAPPTGVSREYRGVLGALYPTTVFWASMLLTPVLCLLRDVAWKYYTRMYRARSYHYIQEMQKYNVVDTRPRVEEFQNVIRKVRQVQRMRRQRGYAFSENEGGGERIVRAYDTTRGPTLGPRN